MSVLVKFFYLHSILNEILAIAGFRSSETIGTALKINEIQME